MFANTCAWNRIRGTYYHSFLSLQNFCAQKKFHTPNYKNKCAWNIAGFHFLTIIKTIQQIKSRIKEIKEDEYSNSLAKIQICAMFHARDIRKNVLLKFIRLCMETPCLCPSEGHKDGGWKLTKTCVIEFCYKKPVVIF